MKDYEKISDLVDKLKACPVAYINIYFSSISDVFPLLTKAEQRKTAQEFHKWGKENAASQPLKFCYAQLLLAMNCFMHDEHEAALHLAATTGKLFEKLNDPDGSALSSALMGGIYRTLGNVELALRTLWESYVQLKRSEVYSHFLSACTFNMAHIYLEMQNYEEALRMFDIMHEQCEKTNDRFWCGYALHGLSKVYLLQKKYPGAKQFLEKAMLIAQEENNQLGISNCITELANFYFQTGDLAEAEQMHKRALAIREQNHFVGGAVTNCIHLGEIYIAQSKLEDALQILNKGLQMAEQIKVNPKIYQVHLLLSKAYECKGEPEQSLLHFRLFHQLREKVEQEDNARRLKNAHLIFEAEQTQKENIVIKKQKAEIEKKNIELQDTIDDLTRAKIGKKAKAFTLVIAIVLFIFEDLILHTVLNVLPGDNYLLSLIVKMVIIFSLSPINKAIETYLLKKVVRNKMQKNSVTDIQPEDTILPAPVLLSYS